MNEFAMTAMWNDAVTDHDAEKHRELVVRAKVMVAGAWPFLAAAQSDAEFEHRLALMLPSIEAQSTPEVLDDVVAGLRADFETMTAQQRTETAQRRNAALVVQGEQQAPAYVHVHHQAGRVMVDLLHNQQHLAEIHTGTDDALAMQAAREYAEANALPIYTDGVHIEGSLAPTLAVAQEFWDEDSRRWIRSESVQRDASFPVTGIFTPDPSDAERYSHYPPTPPSPQSGGSVVAPGNPGVAHPIQPPAVGPDGFPLDIAEGEQRSEDAYARQTTPGAWTVTPGTEWPTRPNAGNPGGPPVYASRESTSGRHSAPTDTDYKTDPDFGKGVSHGYGGRDPEQPQNPAYMAGHRKGQEQQFGDMMRIQGAHRRFAEEGNKSTDDFHNYSGHGRSGGGNVIPSPSLRLYKDHKNRHRVDYVGGPAEVQTMHAGYDSTEAASIAQQLADQHGLPVYTQQGQQISPKDYTASRRTAQEGIVPTPGPNPAYFSQGTNGLMGPAEYPQDPSGGPKTNNNVDDFYGTVPPQVSSGSDGTGVTYSADDPRANAPTPGSNGMTASRRRLGFNRQAAHPVNFPEPQRGSTTDCPQCGGMGFMHSADPAEAQRGITDACYRCGTTGKVSAHGEWEQNEHHRGYEHGSEGLPPEHEATQPYQEGHQQGFAENRYNHYPEDYQVERHGQETYHSPGAQEAMQHIDEYGDEPPRNWPPARQASRDFNRGRTAAWHPMFQPGDHVQDFRGDSATVHRVYPSSEPGKSHRVQVKWDDPERNLTWDGQVHPEGAGDKQAYYEHVFKHHPSVEQEAQLKVDHAIGNNLAAEDYLAGNPTGPSHYSVRRQGAAIDEHVDRYVSWAKSQGHNPDEVATLKRYEQVPGIGRTHTDRIADQLYIGSGDRDWRKSAATDGRIVGHCDHCNKPVRFHTDEDGTDELRHLHNADNRCGKGGGRATTSSRRMQFFDPTDPSVKTAAGDSLERPTPENPSGRGSDEYRARTWDSLVKQRPMQGAEERNINTPTLSEGPDRSGPAINSPYPGTVLDGQGGVRGEDDDEEANSERSRVT